MAPYLAAVRNYWTLLPAIAVCVVLIAIYAIPTLINPQWTSNVLGLFRQQPAGDGGTVEEPARLGRQQLQSRRMLAGALILGALALIGFNVSLNREANGCYLAAKAWGAFDDKTQTADPCIDMIYGNFIGDGTGKVLEKTQQPLPAYQLVHGKKPKYLKWIQNRPSYDETDLLIGVPGSCGSDVNVAQEDTKIVVLLDSVEPCPAENDISLLNIKLKKPLGDRKIVTIDDKPMREINPDMDSWWTVVKKLATGG
ncbi:hypothetical protein EV138_1781 [Kribbella voronezhensis]|uniref:Uncharacterized protein n=1 Tax=Kribbella voronezhensis TaxID=2512212 RepID=A0A4R7T9B5_9ACTN|nr:hypothetical protein EV138_1781 [Kribbella voronezhensis]